MLYCRDNQSPGYEELHAGNNNEVLVAAVVKGQVVIINDVMCFYFVDGAIGDKVVPVWKCRQVLADKAVGTGEDISRGEQVYYIVATGLVSATPPVPGVIGTDYYFCGICKETADEDDTQVLISFWGDEYDHADRA
jgi:hypothetical protein